MRHLEVAGEAGNGSLHHSETFGASGFFARFEKNLHSKTDAEIEPVFCNPLADNIDKSKKLKVLDTPSEGPDAWKHHCRRCLNRRFLPGNNNISTERLKRIGDALQVPHPVVNNGYHSIPFVDGAPFSFPSLLTAIRKARANALKTASTLW